MKAASQLKYVIFCAVIFMSYACKTDSKNQPSKPVAAKDTTPPLLTEQPKHIPTPEGMVWVEGKAFIKGAKEGDKMAMHHEMPNHQVSVDGFFIDITEVTNAQFKAFVNATKYVTIAERPIDWEEMKNGLPDGTPKPADSILQPGSLIFNKNVKKIATMDNYSQWWIWKVGANWKHPEGPKSTIEGKDNYPVVHIAFEDALEYCKWANRRLPTEAEWESAALGSSQNTIFTWGNDPKVLDSHANTWQGVFPTKNITTDGFELVAPVKSYPANSIGIYDMLGNVWEITSDLYNVNYYNEIDSSTILLNPQGPERAYSPENPFQKEHVIKGGSFLCNASYCASFRISARMGMSPDSSSDHTGFRTVSTVKMLEKL